jgi:hypothetical protein
MGKSIEAICLILGLPVLSNFVSACQCMCEKLEKQSLEPFWHRPRILLVRHSFSNSEVLCPLSHGIVVNVEHQLLPQFSLSRSL